MGVPGVPVDPAGSQVDVFVTNRGDETQPTPWIKWVRLADGVGALTPSSRTDLPLVDTLFGDPATRSFEGIAYHDGYLYAAAHTSGVVVVEVAGKNSWGTHVTGRVTVGLPSGG